MLRVAACTIVARNYLALARTLGSSIEAHHPEIDFHVLVVDPAGPAPAFERPVASVWAPAEAMPPAAFEAMAARYGITELSTAVKPSFLAALLERGYDRVIYFDPDIMVLDRLEDLLAALDGAAIVLTPHLLAPIPFDGELPDELSILRAGAYNLGFIALAAGGVARDMLAWWRDRLAEHCLDAVDQGLFVDQRWIDLVPGLFPDVHVLRHPGYNVAYWNLAARGLEAREGRYLAGGAPLVFYHFSGFDPAFPDRLSKHQSRIEVGPDTALAGLLRRYADELARHDHAVYRRLPYGHGAFSNGVPFDAVCRAILREDPRARARFARPFDADAEPAFFAWLNGPARGRGGPTRYMMGLHGLRPDLQARFPDPAGADRAAFERWFALRARESGVPPAFVAAAVGDPAAPPAPDRPGVNLAGYLSAELGIGEAARGYVRALEAFGAEVALTNFTETLNRLGDEALGGFSDANPHPVNLVCVNADEVPNFVRRMGLRFMAGRRNVALWAWELPGFPAAWDDRFGLFDEVWVGSTYMADAIGKRSPIPVVTVPYVITPPAQAVPDRGAFGIGPDEYVFLFTFDYQSVFERKNPLGVVEAFRRAFGPDAPVRLVVKSVNADLDPGNRDRLRQAAAGARVTLLDDYLSRAAMNALLATADAYVSLHRAEGFGLGMAEAMAMGKPVIATAWSGNLEFMNVNNAFLVGYELVPIGRDLGPYQGEQRWAEPDLDHAAALLRQVHDDPEMARRRAERGARDLRERHSPQAVGAIIEARLAQLADRRAGRLDVPTMALSRRKPTLAQGFRFVRQAMRVRPELVLRPEWASSSGHGRPGVWAKRTVQTALRCYLAIKRLVPSGR